MPPTPLTPTFFVNTDKITPMERSSPLISPLPPVASDRMSAARRRQNDCTPYRGTPAAWLRLGLLLAVALLTTLSPAKEAAPAGKLRLHAIFDSDMVLQRGKPIVIWGWAAPGASVSVQLGKDKAEARAAADKGRWEVTFPAREASADPQNLTVTAGGEKVEMGNIVVGDVWVMYGQSNMAFPLGKVLNRDTESAQANLPNLRLFSISTNEQADLPDDIIRETIDTKGWVTSSPEAALQFSAIGFAFGKQMQLSTGIPIGVIKNSRGGASMEALVPIQKFQEIPSGKALVENI